MQETKDAKTMLKNPKAISLVFTTMVSGKKMGVYKREETHEDGERNGTPNNWWLKYEKSSGYEWIPWVDKITNRPCFEFKIREGNYVKYKYDNSDIRGSVFCEIFLNGDKVYEFGAGSIEYATARAVVLKSEIMEHPFDFSNPDGEIGRKVFYKDEPAVVERVILDQGCVILRKDAHGNFKKPIWDDEGWEDEDSTVKEDILSDHIWWWRNGD